MIETVVVPGTWLVLSHALVGVLGYYMGYMIMCKASEAMNAKKGRVMPANPKISAFTILMVAVLIIVGIGAQQFLYQRDQTMHDECVTRWGGQLLDSLDARAGGRATLDNARQVRDSADSKINDSILHALRNPSKTDEERAETLRGLVQVYREARDANEVYRKAQSDYEAAVKANPYPEAPELACD